MMRPNVNRNRVIVALKRAIIGTFDESKWLELGYLTDTVELIQGHFRLLPSLYFGDDDYESCVLQVLQHILQDKPESLQIIEEFVGLEAWLAQHDTQLHAQLYAQSPVSFDRIQKASVTHDVVELQQYATRIKRSINDDPALAVGCAKELLETVLKTIVAQDGQQLPKDDMPKLLKKAQEVLKLDPRATILAGPAGKLLSRCLSNLGQVIIGVSEVRNLLGTGHGRSKGDQIDPVHARLIVNAATTVATYLLEVWEEHRTSD